MSKAIVVDGFTYSFPLVGGIAKKAVGVLKRLQYSKQAAGMGAPIPRYSASLRTGSRVESNPAERVFEFALRLDNMSGSRYSKKDRERFIVERNKASDTCWRVYAKIQDAISLGQVLDHGGDSVLLAPQIASGEQDVGVDGVGQTYTTTGETSGWMDASSGYSDDEDDGDVPSRNFSNGSGFNPGVFYNPKKSRVTEVFSIDPSDVEYVSRPSNTQEDSIFSRVDGVVGGRRASTIGSWSKKPSDDLPNPVRDRAVARGAKYLLGGRAWPADGYQAGWMPKNGLNFDHRGVCGTVEMVIKHCGARAQLYYLHKNPIKVGWTGNYNTISDAQSSGVAATGQSDLVGAVGVNCDTTGMPGRLALGKD